MARAATAAGPLVRWTGVGRTYPGPVPVAALQPTDLAIAAGDHVAVVGPSGAGKSTMLNLLGLLDTPTSGSYHLDGTDVAGLGEADRAGVRARTIGFVFQSFHLLPHRTVVENTELGMLYHGVPRRERRDRALVALARVGLADRAGDDPAVLSGGERQRVALARAVAGRPRVLLCDEPTGNLDSATSASVLDLFESLSDDGITLVVVTHNPDVAARAGRLLDVRDGAVREAR